jgi:hypothetical protein
VFCLASVPRVPSMYTLCLSMNRTRAHVTRTRNKGVNEENRAVSAQVEGAKCQHVKAHGPHPVPGTGRARSRCCRRRGDRGTRRIDVHAPNPGAATTFLRRRQGSRGGKRERRRRGHRRRLTGVEAL